MKVEKRGLVVSGGGSIGAFSVGVVHSKIKEAEANNYKIEYEVLGGNSTGSLQIPIFALNQYQTAVQLYTTTTNDDIMSCYPFDKKTGNKLNFFRIIPNIIKEGTLGNSSNLLNLIKNNFTYSDYINLKQSGKDVIFAVTDLKTEKVKYVNIVDFKTNMNEYQRYILYMFASANNVPFMSKTKIDGSIYADGGYVEHAPITKTIKHCVEKGIHTIDIVMNRPKIYPDADNKKFGLVDVVKQIIFSATKEVSVNDLITAIKLSRLYLIEKNIKLKLNISYTPKVLIKNSLFFDPKQMTEWLNLGYQNGVNDVVDENTDIFELLETFNLHNKIK